MMQYLIAFFEGIITFISPCLLPMLPIYISYFVGGGERTTAKTLKGALGFVTGFTAVFVALGALAGTLGSFLRQYQTVVDIVSGVIVILFGLSFIGVFKLSFFKGSKFEVRTENMGFFSAMLFGVIFSIGWTPCVGAFLGSALMLAAQQAHAAEGMLMLLAYSLGLGIPFVLSAVLIDYLKSAFNWIKKHYKVINIVSGSLLILLGILMATGTFGRFIGLFS
jgi:cytochrome c-type biogenesis protein